MNEAAIQSQIISYLRRSGHLVCRVPLGGVKHTLKGKTFFKKNPLAGFPDLFFLHADKSGRMICVEVKSEKGRQSPLQKEWQAKLESFGITYILARSVRDVIIGLG